MARRKKSVIEEGLEEGFEEGLEEGLEVEAELIFPTYVLRRLCYVGTILGGEDATNALNAGIAKLIAEDTIDTSDFR